VEHKMTHDIRVEAGKEKKVFNESGNSWDDVYR
jgi:hypothetical protein